MNQDNTPQGSISGLHICQLYNLGQVAYERAWSWQQILVQQQKKGLCADTLLLLEHPSVYTLGQGSDLRFLKFDPAQSDLPLYRVERGGEVTYHCPGQLVGYPVLDLKRFRPDLHWYLRQLEEVLIRAVGTLGLVGSRVPGMTGVWVDNCKVAAIGIKVSRWITMHGFALNVCPDLIGFQQIVPCGIGDRPVGSLAQFCPGITVEQIRPGVAAAFAQVFGVDLQEQPEQALVEALHCQ